MLTTLGSILFWFIISPLIAIILVRIIRGEFSCVFSNGPEEGVLRILMSPLMYVVGVCINCLFVIFLYILATFPATSSWEDDPETIKSEAIYSLTVSMYHNGIKVDQNTPFQVGLRDDEKTYAVMIKKNGHFSFKELDAEKYKIVYTDSISPNLASNASGYIIKLWRPYKWFLKDLKLPKDGVAPYDGGTIYVPSNAIIRTYQNGKK